MPKACVQYFPRRSKNMSHNCIWYCSLWEMVYNFPSFWYLLIDLDFLFVIEFLLCPIKTTKINFHKSTTKAKINIETPNHDFLFNNCNSWVMLCMTNQLCFGLWVTLLIRVITQKSYLKQGIQFHAMDLYQSKLSWHRFLYSSLQT